MIRIKSSQEISKMRDSSQLAVEVLTMIGGHISENVSTYALDRICHEYILNAGAIPSSLNYNGFPKSICISINETVCHGIPSKKLRLQSGDIVNIDITVCLNGYHGDTSRMFAIGKISAKAQKLLKVSEEALYRGISALSPGKRLGDMGFQIQSFAETEGYSVVRDFIGHGIGRDFHEDPPIPHVGKKGKGVRLKPGMTFTVEPMINEGTYEVEVMQDGWTVVTRDRKLSAQFEHTVAITQEGFEILTSINGNEQMRRFIS